MKIFGPSMRQTRWIHKIRWIRQYTMVAVLGFTTILGGFSGIGIRARLSCGRVVLDVPFNPTYGLRRWGRKSRRMQRRRVGVPPRLAFCFSTRHAACPLGLGWRIQTGGLKTYGLGMNGLIARHRSCSKRGRRLQRIRRAKPRGATLQDIPDLGFFLPRI